MSDPTTDPTAVRRKYAHALDLALPVIGIALVTGVVAIMQTPLPRMIVAVVGLLVLEAGVWNLASRMLLTRRYHALRAEVLVFLDHVRDLNHSAVAIRQGEHAQAAFDEAAVAMRLAVDRMIEVAGRSDEQEEPLPAPQEVA